MIDKLSPEKPMAQPKKEYRPPALADYGTVANLTRGKPFKGNEGNSKCDTGPLGGDNFECGPLS